VHKTKRPLHKKIFTDCHSSASLLWHKMRFCVWIDSSLLISFFRPNVFQVRHRFKKSAVIAQTIIERSKTHNWGMQMNITDADTLTFLTNLKNRMDLKFATHSFVRKLKLF